MRLTAEELRDWEHKRITLLGMSGIGKTRLATILRQAHWFHYSGDYRIGTRYLDEAILDNIKFQAMQIPFLSELFRSDSIYICNNITVDNLKPLSTFLGKLGNPEHGGLGLKEFERRQALHQDAEIRAMKDVPEFIRKARDIYGYPHFVNDAGGSLCELDDPDVLRILAEHTLILYIKATSEDEAKLIARALADPKPLYYRKAFLDEQIDVFMQEHGLQYVALIDPDEFVRWVFPRLFRSRIPRYEAIASEYGYTVTTTEIAGVCSETDFLQLLARTLTEHGHRSAGQHDSRE